MSKLRTAKDVLSAIEDFAQEADLSEAGKLWSILTALRGPDHLGSFDLKWETTSVIRDIALPTLAWEALTDVNHVYRERGEEGRREREARLQAVLQRLATSDNMHFNDHIRRAVEALLSQ